MLNIHSLMVGLSQSRSIFHSEADFQHALAWQIHEALPESQIRLEFKPFPDETRQIYLDIWVPTEGVVIELKYPTQGLKITHNLERFSLAEQGAQPIQRYEFLNDVQRLENVLERYEPARAGYAILLTNVPGYWNIPRDGNTIDAEFRLHERRKITGRRAWSESAGAGTTKGREQPLDIKGSYDLLWRDYSILGAAGNQRFRYLAVTVTLPGESESIPSYKA